MEETSTVRLNILFGSGREGEKGLQRGVQDFKEDGVVTRCGEPVLSPLVLCGKGLTSAAGHASSPRGLGQGFIFLQKAASHPDSGRMAWQGIQV